MTLAIVAAVAVFVNGLFNTIVPAVVDALTTFRTVSLPISTVSSFAMSVVVLEGVADTVVVALSVTELEPLVVAAVAALVV